MRVEPHAGAKGNPLVVDELIIEIKSTYYRKNNTLKEQQRELKEIGKTLAGMLKDHFQTTAMPKLVSIHPTTGLIRLRLPPQVDLSSAKEFLEHAVQVRSVSLNYRGVLHSHNTPPPATPDDYYWRNDWPPTPDPEFLPYVGYAYLWGHEKIGMRNAWGKSTGGAIIIAVLDTGINYNHPDLRENRWENRNECCWSATGIPEANGLDDDGNGYPDDFFGVNILYETTIPNDLPSDCSQPQAREPQDDAGHGTLIAGTIAAKGNNFSISGISDLNRGMVGISQTAKLMAVKISCVHPGSSFDSPYPADALSGVQYALANGATVVVGSWGLYGGLATDTPIASLKDAIAAGINQFLYVSSAGNDDLNIDACSTAIWPQRFKLDNLIVVAATEVSDSRWVQNAHPTTNPCSDQYFGSNYGGSSVHIAAPGKQIQSTDESGSMSPYGGTSAAAPHVAGCAALLIAQRAPLPKQLKSIIMDEGDAIAGLGIKLVNGQTRRLNCDKALASGSISIPPASPTGLTVR
jgi:subtilisin family serine protease